jgi:hypothetical protein
MTSAYHFITADIEADVAPAGLRILSKLRAEVEEREGIHIPVVWFVRFQRNWSEYLDSDSADAFRGPFADGFDGFELCRGQLTELRARGDEIAWHYHAYNYVYRDDLEHTTRFEILRADLTSCAEELCRRHPDFGLGSFRFGWFFVPDYAIYDHLHELGISRDASIDPRRGQRQVEEFASRYLDPLVTVPTRIEGLSLFPCSQTLVLHDWEVAAHQFSWSQLDEPEAAAERLNVTRNLSAIAAGLKRQRGRFLTFEAAPSSILAEPVRRTSSEAW